MYSFEPKKNILKLKHFKFLVFLFFYLLSSLPIGVGCGGVAYAQTTPAWNPNPTPGGASSLLFRFTNQVWLNPTIILAKQNFEAATNVKLLILPSLNANDTSGSSRIEKAFDKLLAFLVYKDNIQGSIKFYFDPLNPAKPFTFNTSEECKCKFTPIQKDTVEQLLNQNIANSTSLTNFAALPFDSVITNASLYCKKILMARPQPCGPDSSNNFTLTKINTTPAKLNFESAVNLQNPSSPNGAVDKQKYTALAQNYNTVVDIADNSNYAIAWKAMKAGNDVIKLKLQKKQNSFDVSKLVFKNVAATETYNTTFNTDSTLSLSFGGKAPGSMAEVVAFYTPPATVPPQTFAIGAFNIQFYQPETLKVVLVNLGNAAMPDITAVNDTLNKIYGSVFIKWIVDTANCPLPSGTSKSIHIESSGLLSNYMPDMQPIVSYFKSNCSAYNASEENTYYLLFGCTNDGSLLGYMPRARNAGFIFDVSPHTIAHELGHGAFNLKHIFSSDELGEGNKGLTNNIMDYSSGSALYKHQWDLIHDPSFVGWFEGDDADAAYETDGHYSTVYLVCLMLGMDKSLAKELAVATEDPDTDVNSEIDFEIDQTWAYPAAQQEIHSLTGGFHSVEEMMTAFKLIYIDKNEKKKIGELLHRYGDTYAHTRLDNFMPEKLKDYEFADSVKLKLYILQWKNQNSPQIIDRIAPWVSYLNYYLNIYGYKFLTDESLQREHLNGKNLIQYLHSLYPNQPVDKFKLYGDGGYTTDHALVDKALPDYIYVRPKWYLSYVQNLSALLQYKYNDLTGVLDLSLFTSMVQFATTNTCSLKGIIDYEIAKKRGDAFFYIPVFYSTASRPAASYDAVFNTNYLKVAKDALESTKKYLNSKNIKFKVIEINGTTKYNLPEGYFTLQAYKIELLK